MKNFFSGSIRRMAMLVVFLSVLPPLVILFVSGLQSYREAYDEFERRTTRSVHSIAEREQSFVRNTVAILSALQRVSALKPFDQAFSQEMLSEIIAEYPHFRNIFMISPSGRVLRSGLPVPEDIRLADLQRHERALRYADFSVNAVGNSPFGGDKVMQFAIALKGANKEVYAYLCADVRLTFFDTLFTGDPLPEGGVVLLLNDAGLLVRSSSRNLELKAGEAFRGELWQALRVAPGNRGTLRYLGGDGKDRFATYERLLLPGGTVPYLYVVLSVPRAYAEAVPAAVLSRDMFFVAVAALCALLGGLFLCHRGFALPIRLLLGAAQRLGGGDLSARISRHRHLRGEFAALNDEFNAMANALELRSLELEDARESATRSSRAKSEFLANMSHEIRTPMNAILGMAHLVGRTPLNEGQTAQVDKIRHAADDLLRLLNNILDFSKIEAGKMPVERLVFHLGRLLNDVRASGAAAAKAQGTRLVSNIPPGVPPQLAGDPSRLTQALGILLQEAIRRSQGNPVELGCRVEDKTEDSALFYFTKSVYGPPLSEEALEHIRTCLSGDNLRSMQLEAGELALMLAGSIMHLLGGGVTVENMEKGFRLSAFLRVDLPHRPAEAQPLHFDGERVLVLSENTGVRKAFREQLEGYCLAVDECATVSEGVEMLLQADERQKPFAAIIAELLLELPQGPQAIAALKNGEGLSRPPMVILSTPQEWGTPAPAFFEAGLDAFLPRPINESFLVDALSGMMAGKLEHEAGREAQSAAGGGDEPRFDGLRVLLVEDNAVNREIAREVLTSAGVTVSEAVNGQEALNALEEHPYSYDLVLMDLEMPVMGGLSAVRALRAQGGFSAWRLPVIAMTAHSGPDEVADCLEAGMNDYTGKPLVLADLFKALGRWLPVEEARKKEAAGYLKRVQLILERSHSRDPELGPLLDKLEETLSPGRMESLKSLLAIQEVSYILTLIGDYLALPDMQAEAGD